MGAAGSVAVGTADALGEEVEGHVRQDEGTNLSGHVGLVVGGFSVLGIPLNLKQAMAEYSVRAVVEPIDPDPEVDPSGAQIQAKREKVGPIEEATEYVPGTHLVVVTRPYPAADRLLREYVAPVGAVR